MPDYDSPFFITNDRADIDQAAIDDGTAVVWPLSDDAKLRRSPERQYCGNYVTYGDNGAATYRHNDDTHDLIAAGPHQHRDMTSSFPLVKTLAKAQARGDRQLLDVQDQDVRITTRLEDIPATRVTLAKAGMRIQIKGTHWGPTCDDWHYARIVTAQPMPHGKGELFDIDLELALGDESSGPPAPPYTGDVFAGLQHSYVDAADDPNHDGYGLLGYGHEYATDWDAGWYQVDITGPIAVDQAAAPYRSLTVSAPMDVRIHATAGYGGVYVPDLTATLNVLVNGVIVGTDSATLSGLAFGLLDVDLRDYHLEAGDVVSYSDGGVDINWGNGGVNETFLQVGRGTITDGLSVVFVGP